MIRLRFNRRQLDKLADIFSDIGLVIFASMVIPYLFDRINLNMLILGLVATLISWTISLNIKK